MSVTRLANFISIAANPVLLLLGAVMVVINHYVDSTATFWHHSGYAALLLVAPGGLYTIYLWRKVGEIDLDISNREDRIVPMMLTILGAVVGTALLARSQTTGATLETMSYVLVALLITLTTITLVWKISIHTATLSALTTLMAYFGGPNYAWFFILLIPVAWARAVLHQHTKAQLLGGAIWGALITWVLAWFFSGR